MRRSCRSHEFHSTDNLHLQPPFLENPRGKRSTASGTSGFSSNKNTLCECACAGDELRCSDVRRNFEVTFKELDNSDSVFVVWMKASRQSSIQNIRQDKNGFTNCSPSLTVFTRSHGRSVLRLEKKIILSRRESEQLASVGFGFPHSKKKKRTVWYK